MKKMNNKGYILVEIIVAFSIGFILLYFMMDLVIKLKNKNDDLVVDTIIKTDQTIISNKILEHIIKETKDPENITFSCDKIEVDTNNQTVKYNDELITIVDNTAKISYNHETDCSIENGKVSIKIPVDVKQMPDKDYDIKINYRYKLMQCNPVKSYSCANNNKEGEAPYAFTYTGNCQVIDDGNGDWRIKFLTNGIFKSECDMVIDAFLVGGGGGGQNGPEPYLGGRGGGGGYTITGVVSTKKNEEYSIVIGKGREYNIDGEATTAFNLRAAGGKSGSNGGNGGSGGGGSGMNGSINGGAGGSNGNNGISAASAGGVGQGISTCEFNEPGCTIDKLYAGGGGGGGGWNNDGASSRGPGGSGGGGYGGDGWTSNVGYSGAENKGGGGGGGYPWTAGGKGGSGIVVIRNNKIARTFPNTDILFEYTGMYKLIDDKNGNWRLKFLTSGEFLVHSDIKIDAFLVGGGGGGQPGPQAYLGGRGGGGGYTTTKKAIPLEKNKWYTIQLGSGGSSGMDGETTIAFDERALGGKSGSNDGAGGSGGGGCGMNDNYNGGNGGKNGGDGEARMCSGGQGQGSTTCEFGALECTNDKLYAGGGGGGNGWTNNGNIGSSSPGLGGLGGGGTGVTNAVGGSGGNNTGGGGAGGGPWAGGGTGGSGIIVIRNAR